MGLYSSYVAALEGAAKRKIIEITRIIESNFFIIVLLLISYILKNIRTNYILLKKQINVNRNDEHLSVFYMVVIYKN
jgi:hypothetical protein